MQDPHSIVVVLVKHQDCPPLSTFIHVEYFFPLNSNGTSQMSLSAVLHAEVFLYSFESKYEKITFLNWLIYQEITVYQIYSLTKITITFFIVSRNNLIASFFACHFWWLHRTKWAFNKKMQELGEDIFWHIILWYNSDTNTIQ